MVVSDASIHNIMGGMESTAGVRLHNHRRKLKQRFDIIKKLGQGTYGKVQLGINKETGQEVAIKTIKKAKIETEADLVRIRREIQIMSSVQHPNIIHIYEVFENREKMVLVMEYAAGGELYDFLSERKVLAEEEARRIFRQIATAVYYCHKHKICHRDLKLENILLDEHGSAKIADFGLSNVFDDQRLLNTFCGSPLYASPEIVKGTPYHGPEVDCWSLGVLLYTLVYGAMPFDGSNFKRLVKQISQGDYFEPKKPSPASPLIREMLTVTPARRADIEKICSHWWVNEGHADSCLDIAEELANQTPVRLDLLLSLAPPPPAVGSDKMLLTHEQEGNESRTIVPEALGPPRCHSVGSLMDLDQPTAERRLREFERGQKGKSSGDVLATKDTPPKRKLEEGISTEDAARGGAKKKERVKRREQSVTRSDVEENKPSTLNTEEKMDVDMAEPGVSKNASELVQDSTVADVLDAAVKLLQTEPAPEEEGAKALATKERSTRKSVKGSTKKSKPSAVESVQSNAGEPSNDSVASETKVAQTEEEKTDIGETKVEDTAQVALQESNKLKPVSDESVTETVKPKVKKKKKVLSSSKSEDLPEENVQKTVEENNTTKSSQIAPDESSSQTVKSESDDNKAKSCVPSSKNDADIVRTNSVKAKKNRSDLGLGKLSSSADKPSGAEDLPSPTKPVERRRSKIFENGDKFNIFLGGSESKSPTTEKPKKVFIPGVKVSDYKQAFERRSSLTSTSSLPTPVKNTASKKAIDSSTKVPSANSSNENKIDTVKSDSEKVPCAKEGPADSSLKHEESVPNDANLTENSVEPSTNTKNLVGDVRSEKVKEEETDLKLVPALQATDKVSQQEKAKIKKLKDAVEVISNAIAEETRKEANSSAPRKISSSKPPVPSTPEKTKTKSAASSNSSSPKSPPVSPNESTSDKKTLRVQVGPNDVRQATFEVSTPQSTKFPFDETSVTKPSVETPQADGNKVSSKESESTPSQPNTEASGPAKKKSAKVEITLKSATLPRRRTSKAEIQLGFPSSPKVAETETPGEYRTEVEHMVGNALPSRLQTQRSEVAFPVAAATNVQPLPFRSSSLEPESAHSSKHKPRERIIPIHVERDADENHHPAPKPPVPPMQQQRSLSQRASSLSRQSTQDSDTDSTISATGPEPIRKSPREYIIPIAVEGGGYVTPRAGSLEPSVSETSTEASRHQQRSSGRFSRPRRMSSLLSDSGASEDEGFNSLSSPFSTLQRHKDGENPDDDRPFHHMHRLRSSRPTRRPTLDHNDSLSSAEEEDDDDDGFEILTAESLFSTLLSRVRSLTQRLNVEDGGRPGFPSSRLMSHLAATASPSTGFWGNVYTRPAEPLARRVSENSHFSSRPYDHEGDSATPWRRSASRDMSDSDSVYSTKTNSVPRGTSRCDSDDAASSLCYFSPGLTRRMHSSSEEFNPPVRKSSLGSLTSQPSPRRLARTLSLRTTANEQLMNTPNNSDDFEEPLRRKDRLPSNYRSSNLLDSRDNSSIYRSSAASDCDDYSHRVLPPLPYNIGSQGRRRDTGRNSSYLRQRSVDLLGSPYRMQHSKIQEEVVTDRPHHSSSLPSLSKAKGKKTSGSYVPDSNQVPSNTEVPCPHLGNSHSVVKSVSGSRSKPAHTADSHTPSTESKGSHIPSLLRFRSSSVSRDTEKKKKDNPKKDDEASRRPRSASTSRSTPDRSILSKFFKQGSDEKEINNEKESVGEDKKKRRISRFLRPDFFDTPREESVYAKEKDAKKAAEAENKSKVRRSVRKSDSNVCATAEGAKKSEKNSALSQTTKKCESKPAVLKNKHKPLGDETFAGTGNSPINHEIVAESTDGTSSIVPICAVEPENKSQDVESTKKSEDIPAVSRDPLKNSQNGSLIIKNSKISDRKLAVAEKTKPENNAMNSELMEKSDNNAAVSKTDIFEPRVVSDLECDALDSGQHTERSVMNPQTCKDTETANKQNEEQKKAKSDSKKVESTSRAFEKQSANTNSKSRFLHSLEKKLEKFRSAGDDIPSSNSSGKSRVDKAIHSLREQTLNPRGGDIITSESHLLKRAVSVSDCCTVEPGLKNQVASSKEKLGNKVTSVLGLFKKLEDKRQSSLPQSSVLSRLRRTQSVYAGSQSDGVLVNAEVSLPSSHVKKTALNSDKKSNKIQKNDISATNTQSAQLLSENRNTDQISRNSSNNNNNINNSSSSNNNDSSISNNNSSNSNNNSSSSNNNTSSSNNNNGSSSTNMPINIGEDNFQENLKKEELINSKCEQSLKVADNEDILKPNNNKSPRPATLLGLTKDNTCSKQNAGLVDNEIAPSNVDNSPLDDYSLNDDEVKFANVKRLDSYSYPADDSSVLSPADESESFDSWSVCSDFENREYPTSPVPPLGDDIEESVGDRIRRKSFYTRFNDIKKRHRKPSLSSIGSLSSSYRDPDTAAYLRNFSKKKDYISSCSHKPHRSQSLYDAYNRKSPVLPRSQQMENNSSHQTLDGEVNGYMTDPWPVDTSRGGEHLLGGSMETLRMPRHFNHSINLGTAHIPTRRASESRLSRSIESNIGSSIPKSRLPVIWDRHLTSSPRLSSSSSGVSYRPDSALRLESVTGETSPLHGKYNRYNSHSPLDSASVCSVTGENIWMESERPSTPH